MTAEQLIEKLQELIGEKIISPRAEIALLIYNDDMVQVITDYFEIGEIYYTKLYLEEIV